jgi:predicted glycoside hydrolase/deacetylase ChbG (UPF0249 family)
MDAAKLRDHMPNHPVWEHPVFQTEEYIDFVARQKQYLDTHAANVVPSSVIQPDVARMLREVSHDSSLTKEARKPASNLESRYHRYSVTIILYYCSIE